MTTFLRSILRRSKNCSQHDNIDNSNQTLVKNDSKWLGSGILSLLKKHSYIDIDTKGNNILTDTVFVARLPSNYIDIVDESEFDEGFQEELDEDKNVIYSWKKTQPKLDLNFLLDDDHMFDIDEYFLIKLKHGNGFNKGAIFVGNNIGFNTILCLKTSGVTGLYIPNTLHLKPNVRAGDYVIARSSRGISFLPQVGGESIFLIVTITPSRILTESGIFITPLSDAGSTEPAKVLISNRRRRAIELIDEVINDRKELESIYLKTYMLSELIKIYKSDYSKKVQCILTDNLKKANGHVNELVDVINDKLILDKKRKTTVTSNSLSAACHRKRVIFSSQLEQINNFFDIVDNDINNVSNCSLEFLMIDDIKNKSYYMKKLWEKIEQNATTIDKLLEGNSDSVNNYVANLVLKSESAKTREEIINNLQALSRIGFRI
ncbi:RhoA signalling inhibitor, virus release protein [Eptesipox virus]|uniref:RhoA signalling inhibitor, virus release protein n=1 Tax=Eptesipox virus TaxID=1329402 RepID=A0A220T685_9POXV|nr:RhoA signalling inhibitor, virus release protein [Eptesipox virus]ASK51228.1 RhoA signalling inhibitor, virus release protein [Eptesipox virus]WAH70986.1 RhoA signaling inhibitor, virus release protein [Eptesipox virus]